MNTTEIIENVLGDHCHECGDGDNTDCISSCVLGLEEYRREIARKIADQLQEENDEIMP